MLKWFAGEREVFEAIKQACNVNQLRVTRNKKAPKGASRGLKGVNIGLDGYINPSCYQSQKT